MRAAGSAGPTPPLPDVGKLSSVATARITSTRGLLLPIEKYDATPAERNVVADAITVAVRRCMAGFGLGWSPATRPVQRAGTAAGAGLRHRGPGTAATLGYHAEAGGPAAEAACWSAADRQLTVYGRARDVPASHGSDVPRQEGACRWLREQGLAAIVGDPTSIPTASPTRSSSRWGPTGARGCPGSGRQSRLVRCMARAGYRFSDRWRRPPARRLPARSPPPPRSGPRSPTSGARTG